MLIIFKNKNKYRIFEKKNMIKAGVVGAGHLGSIHLKLLNESKYFELIGSVSYTHLTLPTKA